MLVTIVRTVILYVVIILAMRIMGKRQVGDMQPGDLVVSLLISEIAAMPIEDVNKPMINGLIAVFMLVFLETVLSLVSLKSGKARRAINGRPAIVINRGRVDQSALRRLRMTTDDLLEGLRQEGIFDLTTVQYAIIETNGQLSVLKNRIRAATWRCRSYATGGISRSSWTASGCRTERWRRYCKSAASPPKMYLS